MEIEHLKHTLFREIEDMLVKEKPGQAQMSCHCIQQDQTGSQ